MTSDAIIERSDAGLAAALLDAVSSPLATMDSAGRLIAFNRAFRALVSDLGRSATVGQMLSDVIGALRADAWLVGAERARVLGTAVASQLDWGPERLSFELLLTRGDAARVHAEFRRVGGADSGAGTASVDALLQNLTDMVLVVDSDLRVRGFNPVFGAGAATVLGRPLQIGEHVQTLVAPSHWAQQEAAYGRALQGESLFLDQTIALSSGFSRVYETSLNPIRENGVVTGVVNIARNVTQRKLDEEATRRLAQSRRAIIEAIPDAITVVSRDGKMLDFKPDPSAPSLLRAEDFVGRNVSEFADPTFAIIRRELARAFETGEMVSFEYEIAVAGRVRYRDTRIKTVDSDTALILVRDVTEQRELSRRLLAADRMASLGTLAAGVGHELNNPLMFVMSNLQVAREELGGLGHVELQTALADAADGAERMRKIIRDLRSFSRQDDSPDVEGSPQRAVQLALNMTQATMSAKARILFTPGETGTVRLSEGRLAQVVVNLLANAVQSFGKDRDPATNEVRVGVLARGGDAVIEVVDNGPGIASDIIGRIFDPFFTTKPVGEGTGLGLSLAHSIVTEAGGRFDVESTVGVGTKFTVVLPQRIVKAPAAAVAQVRVLIVDDDDRVKKALAMLLRGKYAVSSAASGEEALALVDKEATFDLILSDVLMPGMNGIELIQRLRDQRRDGPSPRLALMSGGIFDEQMRAQITALGVPPLNKPFDRNDVQRLLAQPERG